MSVQPTIDTVIPDAFQDWLATQGYTMTLPMGDGMWVGIKRLMFHWTLHTGVVEDRCGYEGRWCYADFSRALTGMLEWAGRDFEGEPAGWRKHPATDRCRNDDGDPESETIGWPGR